MQACLVLKQFEYILNVTEYVNENYLRVKEKFLRAIDYIENINVGEPSPTDSSSRHSEHPFDASIKPDMPINVYTAKSRFSLISPVAD